jgi:dipeptide/tripeptide permease
LEKKEFAGYAMLGLLIVIFGYLISIGLKSDRVTLQRIIALIILLICNMVFWASFEQAGNSLNFFARDQVKLKSEERFPLGGTRGNPVESTATTITLDSAFARVEPAALTVSYPSPTAENRYRRDDATGEVAPGTYAARTPLPVVLKDKNGASKNADLAPLVAASNAAAAKAKAAGDALTAAKKANAPESQIKDLADAAEAADKESALHLVDHVVGPRRKFEWFQSVNAIFIVLLGPLFTMLWAWLHRRGSNPSIPFKFGLGLIQVGLGFALLIWSFKGADAAGLVPWYMLTGLYLIHTTAELCISPVGLSMVTKLAPASITGMVMGGWFLSIANANYAAGLFSALVGEGEGAEGAGAGPLASYESAFTPIVWMAISAGVVILLLSKPVNKLMHGVK